MKKLFKTLLPVLVVALAVLGAVILMKTRPRSQPKELQEYAAQVTVQALQKTQQPVQLKTSGTVVPARSISLQSRVGGEVLSMNEAFLPGGRISLDERILKLDPEDYELALDLRQSELAQAELSHAKEQGMQTVARHEWDLIDSREDLPQEQQDLILRKPHLKASAASLEGARASVRQAKLNLERTDVQAPFDAVVLERLVDVGAQVSAQTVLGTLAGTDEYWVEATLPTRDLHWLTLPAESGEKGSPARIEVRGIGAWDGYIKKLDAQLEGNGRLAQVRVAIPDPLAPSENRMPLILGSHVQVDLEGAVLEDVFVLPRSAYHEGQSVWIMNTDNRLEIRDVEPIWSNADVVVIQEGLQEGEQLVVSDLAVPARDLLLSTESPEPQPDRSGPPSDSPKERPAPPASNPEK
jgi:RND family efflux transporter MFP subunit